MLYPDFQNGRVLLRNSLTLLGFFLFYWLCSQDFRDSIEKAFPDILYHETKEAKPWCFFPKL